MTDRVTNTCTNQIYYLNTEVSEKIAVDFNLIDQCSWHELYQNTIDKSYWRLDKFDKHQVQYFVRLPSKIDWINFDSTELQITLLRTTRGISTTKCIWTRCENIALKQLAYCEAHAFKEMGIRE